MDLPPASIQELNHQKLQNKSPKERKKKEMNPNFLLRTSMRTSFEEDAARVASFQAHLGVAHNTHTHTLTHRCKQAHTKTNAGALCGQSRWGQMGRQRGGPH